MGNENKKEKKEYVASTRIKPLFFGDAPKTKAEEDLLNHAKKHWNLSFDKNDKEFVEFVDILVWGSRKGELMRGATPQNEKEKHYLEVEVPESRARMDQMWENLAKGIQKLEEDKKAFEELLIKYGKKDYVTGGKFKNKIFLKYLDLLNVIAVLKVEKRCSKSKERMSSPRFNYEVRQEVQKMLPKRYRHYKLTEEDMPPSFEEELYKFLKERDAMNKKTLIIGDYFF